eukprot:tig00020629_g12323.t1
MVPAPGPPWPAQAWEANHMHPAERAGPELEPEKNVDDINEPTAAVVELGLDSDAAAHAAPLAIDEVINAGHRAAGIRRPQLVMAARERLWSDAEAAPAPALAAACAAFCPRLVLGHCRGRRLRETCEAVVALLDLAGFSDLVAKCSAGESDMEQLFDAINSCFRAEIELLEGPPPPRHATPYPAPTADRECRRLGLTRRQIDAGTEGDGDSEGRLAAALSLRAATAAECALRVR